MSEIQKQLSKIKDIDRYQDVIIEYVDDVHARIMKLFPMCLENEDIIDINDFRRFHIRMYLPEAIYKDKSKKASKCFILYNGLNEVKSFYLYDQIGKDLAKAGYATILLPLPNHLNRNLGYRTSDPNNMEKPSTSFVEEPEKIFSAFKQVVDETSMLISHIRQECPSAKTKKCCSLFSHFFETNTNISIFGYSLGGLVALSYFLLNSEKLSSCIMLNSGAKLSDIDVSFFLDSSEWKEMVKSLQNNRHRVEFTAERNVFDQVFLGNDEETLKDSLEGESSKLLFILGGSDSVTRRKGIRRIEPDNHGLAILQLPGIHHFLFLDIHWDQWFPIVMQTIISFDRSASADTLSANDILDTIIKYQINHKIIENYEIIVPEKVDDYEEKILLERTLFAAECVFGRQGNTLIEVYKLIKNSQKSPKLFPSFYDKFLSSLSEKQESQESQEILQHISELIENHKSIVEQIA